MATYTVVVKKGEIEFSFSGTDKDFVVSQIDLLFSKLKVEKKPIYDNSASAKIDIVQNKELKKPSVEEKKSDNFVIKTDIAEKTEENTITNYTEAPPSVFDENTQPQPTIEEKNDRELDLLFSPKGQFDEEDEIVEEPISATKELISLENSSKTAEEPSSSEQNTKEVTEENIETQDTILPMEENQEPLKETVSFGDFDNILAQKMTDGDYLEETQKNEPKNYDELIKNVQTDNLIDYLIITAYYMLENEHLSSFQLKQLNSKLFSSMKMMVDRKTVQRAISEGLLFVVSDGSENGGIVEYALSPAGREYYLNAGV